MIDITKLSSTYFVRRMNDDDADDILRLCLANTQYYDYCGKQPEKELILSDLHITPPGISPDKKHYIGFYNGEILAAVMDLIEGYPDESNCYIGFFMMNKGLQGRGTGSKIISEVCDYLKESGFISVMLGIDRDNPQSKHFWQKNGFVVIRETEQDGGTILVAEKTL